MPSNEVPLAEQAPAQQQGQLQKLQAVLNRFEISIAEANELVVLEDYEMCIIADDSGSMQRPAAPANTRTIGQESRSRWDELKETVSEMVEIAACFDKSGIDVFFLNRQPLPAVKSAADQRFINVFAAPPSGTTPLTETLEKVAQKMSGERPVLLFILTDGEPNGGKWPLIRMLQSLTDGSGSTKLRIQIMACTSEEDEIGWLNEVDSQLKQVDVTDDYYSEKQEVLRAGIVQKFTRGDWCLKAMIGPISKKFDAWDERMGRGKYAPTPTPECDLCVVS